MIAFCVIAAALALILKQYRPEYAMIIVATASCTALLFIIMSVMPAIEEIRQMVLEAGGEALYFSVLFKSLGICYITKFASDLCRDSGQTSMASKIDFAGKAAILILSLPLIESLLDIAIELIG